jgi:hypothetical protein
MKKRRYRPQRATLREAVEIKDGAELLGVLPRQLAPRPVRGFELYPYTHDEGTAAGRPGW